MVLGSDFIRQTLEYESVGATMDNLSAAIVSKVYITVPPIMEQHETVRWVDFVSSELSALIEKQVCVVTKLNELKQSIIASAVTGKIKV